MGCSKDLVEGDNTLLGCFTATTQLLQSPNVGSGIGPAIGGEGRLDPYSIFASAFGRTPCAAIDKDQI